MALGSPPRMRGKGAPFRAGALPLRITPAYAGKSQTAGTPCSSVRDHPRMCGEKLWPTCPHAPNAGSPPRMRGKDRLSGKSGQPDRITPACAEKRPARPGYAYNRGDHPRMCEEKSLNSIRKHYDLGSPPHVRGKAVRSLFLCLFCRGSPPRMRGKGEGQGNSHQERRITPAYAGKSSHSMLAFCIRRGSPPHVRGKVCRDFKPPCGYRITPACAGKRA